MKVNMDDAFFENEGVGRNIGCLKDDRSNLLVAQCKFISYASDVVTKEAMVMRDGLDLANSLGFNRLEAEFYSLHVIYFCTGWTRWWDAAITIFTECVWI